MPYENNGDTKQQLQVQWRYSRTYDPDGEVYRSTHGIEGIVTHVDLDDRWAASLRDGSGTYSTLGVYDTIEEARDALRRQGIWHDVPHA